MSNDNNLNDIIKSKFSNQEHPFDEANWKSMRTMIDDSRAKKKRTMFLIGSLALLLCAGGAFGIYELNNNSGKTNTGNVIATSNNTSVSSATNNQPTANSSTQAVSPSPKPSAGNTATSSSTNIPVAANNQTVANGNNAVAAVSNSHAQKSVVKKHRTKSGNSGIIASDKEIADLNKTMDDIEKNTTVENVLSLGESTNPSSTTPQLPVNSTPPVAPKTPPPPVPKTYAKAPDTASSLPQRFSDEPRVFMGKKQMISIDAGTYYSTGWKPSISITQGKGWNYVVGVGYTRYLKSKLFLKTGLQFSDYGQMNSYSYNYESSSPQNPNVIHDSIITTKRLYYLSIPVQLELFIGHKSSIGFGGSLSYLLSSNASATAYQQLDNNPPMNINNYSQDIHLNGYNKLSASAYLLYRFTYNRHFSFYVMPYFMTPVESKSFFAESDYLYNKGAKFILSYTL